MSLVSSVTRFFLLQFSEENQNITEHQDIVDISELINPFPGLRPFGVEESHLFFGRECQSDEVLIKLAENRFAAILGASGSGKSSFMYCGLVPSLLGGFMTDAGSNWRVVVARPGGGPIDNLAEALLIKDRTFSDLFPNQCIFIHQFINKLYNYQKLSKHIDNQKFIIYISSLIVCSFWSNAHFGIFQL